MARHSWRARLALATLRLYPRRWRQRYEDELCAHIEDHGARGRDLVDLAAGAARERWYGPNGPDPGDHPYAAAAWRTTARIIRRVIEIAAVATPAYTIGWTAGSSYGPPTDTVLWALATSMLIPLVMIIRVFRQTRQAPPAEKMRRRISANSWSMLYILATQSIAAGWAHDPFSLTKLVSMFMLLLTPMLDQITDRSGRRMRIYDAGRQYFRARNQLKAPRRELARLDALGLPPDHPGVIRVREVIAACEARIASAIEVLRDPDRADAAGA